METLQAIYIALAVFGVGVTIVDLFGALEHGDAGQDHGGHAHGGHDHGGQDHGGAGHAQAGQAASDHGATGHGEAGHGDAHHGHAESLSAESGAVLGQAGASLPAESVGQARSAGVARVIGGLRLGVYFSLGAGPTGIAALAMGLGAVSSFLWSAGAGLAIAILARSLRKLVRRDLDSSFKPEDFILEEAEVTVPVAPGLIGKAEVTKFGAQAEVYVRAAAEDRAFARGDRVRIIDVQDDCYIVEAADEEHLVH